MRNMDAKHGDDSGNRTTESADSREGTRPCLYCQARKRIAMRAGGPACCSAMGSPDPRSRCGLGGVPGERRAHHQPAETARSRHYLAGDGADQVGRLVRRSRPRFRRAAAATDEIFVMGLSMGGCLSLRLAELRGDAVSGLVLVNPSVTAEKKLFLLAPVLKLVVPSLKGIASDIKKEGANEVGYDRVPVKAAATLPGLWQVTTRNLKEVSQPVSCTAAPPIMWLGRPTWKSCAAPCLPANLRFGNSRTATTSRPLTTMRKRSSPEAWISFVLTAMRERNDRMDDGGDTPQPGLSTIGQRCGGHRGARRR